MVAMDKRFRAARERRSDASTESSGQGLAQEWIVAACCTLWQKRHPSPGPIAGQSRGCREDGNRRPGSRRCRPQSARRRARPRSALSPTQRRPAWQSCLPRRGAGRGLHALWRDPNHPDCRSEGPPGRSPPDPDPARLHPGLKRARGRAARPLGGTETFPPGPFETRYQDADHAGPDRGVPNAYHLLPFQTSVPSGRTSRLRKKEVARRPKAPKELR